MSSEKVFAYLFLFFLIFVFFADASLFRFLLSMLPFVTLGLLFISVSVKSKNAQQREPVNRHFFKRLCSLMEGVYERSTEDGVEIERFVFRLGKRPVRIHYRFETQQNLEVLEVRIRLRQKFWLFMNRERPIFYNVKWLDGSYAIQSNQPEAAKDFLQRLSVQKHLRNFPCSFDKLEIVRGEICVTLYDPSLWNMNPHHLSSLIVELQQIVEEYEQHEIIVLRVFPVSVISHCPYCRNSFDQPSDMLLNCKNCHTQIHESCWNENGQCTTWGCSSTLAERADSRILEHLEKV